MKYFSEFKDINNKPYRVELNNLHKREACFSTPKWIHSLPFEFSALWNRQSTEYLKLAETPIVTTIEGSDNIYKPCKYSSASVDLIVDNPRLDFYSGKAKGTRVTLYSGEEIKWVGYVEPTIYSQEYESDVDLLELDCIDGLAVLQYIEYKSIGEKPLIHNVIDIIKNILKKSECYTYFFFPNSYTTDLRNIELAEQNFFDEDGEAMKCDEVLEEITKYLGFTCIAEGDKVYFLDYDYIKHGGKSFYKYSINGNEVSLVNIQDTKSIGVHSYTSNGQRISLGDVYNKVTIRDDLYTVHSVIPDIFDESNLINWNGSGNIEVKDESLPEGYTGRDDFKLYTQYFKSNVCKSYYYDVTYTEFPDNTKSETWADWKGDILTPIDDTKWTGFDYKRMQDTAGATLVKRYQQNITQEPEEPNSLKMENILMITPSDALSREDKPLFTIPINLKQVFAKNFHLVIDGQVAISRDKKELFFPNREHNESGEWELDLSQLYLRASLKFNGKWWSGSNETYETVGNWVDYPTTFKIFLGKKNTDKKNFCHKYFPIRNTIQWNEYLNSQGFEIPIPQGKLDGAGEFTIYSVDRRLAVKDTFYKGKYVKEWDGDKEQDVIRKVSEGVQQDVYFIKDLKVELVTPNNEEYIDKDEHFESDTLYSNVIDEDYVKEFDDISLKVCTWDDKEPNYSCVIFNNDYLDKTVHSVFNTPLRQEEHLIERIVNQYKEPSIVFDFSLHNDYKPYSLVRYTGKEFIVDSQEIDWGMDRNNIKLIEKK